MARALCLLGQVAGAQGDAERASALLKESLVWRPTGAVRDIVESLEGLAGLAAIREQAGSGNRPSATHAARLLGAAAGAREATGIALPPGDRAAYERDVAAIRARLDEATWRRACAEGQAMTLEQAVAYALEVDEKHTDSSHTG